MELGGKSPFVVFDDADLARALDAAIFMIFSNNGERCTAGSRILVQQRIYADFVAKFTQRARRISVGDPLDENTVVGPMISPEHLAKVRRYIELGPQGGGDAHVRGCGAAGAERSPQQGQFRQADGVRRCRQPHAHRAGGDFRPGRMPDSVRGRSRCDREGERYLLRPVELRVEREYRPRTSRRGRHRSRHVLRQQPERTRSAPAVRRHEGVGHRPRRRHLELRGVSRAEERMRQPGLAPHSALGGACEPLSDAEVSVRDQSRSGRATAVSR